MKLNCVIIDDEPVARKGMEEYVLGVEFLHLVASFESALKASSMMDQGTIDLIFLDIQMPKLSGVDFLKSLRHPPMAIFTTAFSEYALEGYSLDVIDYLVKPISMDRFMRAVNKAREFHALKHSLEFQQGIAPDYFFIKCDGKYEKVHYREVAYLEAMQNYVIIHTPEKKLITYMTISGLESQLPKEMFVRVHKSYVVSISKIKSIEGNELIMNGIKIPISRNLKEEVMKRILGGNLLSR